MPMEEKKPKQNSPNFNVKNNKKFMTKNSMRILSKWDFNQGVSETPYNFEKSLDKVNLNERMFAMSVMSD